MISVEQLVPAPAEAVFAVLSDGWSYAGWVVGNSHIREVDPDWPVPGSRIHHSAGVWPAQIRDTTRVHAVEPGRLLELRASLWLFGGAVIRFTLTPRPPAGTHVLMEEEAVDGPSRLIPAAVQALALRPRNREALARLSDLAAGRHATGRLRHGSATRAQDGR
ncbi:polyketide cyclase [Amycolatopsis antarctica]|uniref:Polyketide cyclase n=1 Tax=Amycolatopsis antarctica TaxID=1854586 RepID=A0A263D1Z4_9PSEU|nr:SRPBCC family protein [Amycolatopsis antarctica]OZM72484.1 polyketide cyclase [Amycolatopsis antarctica]